MGIGDDVKSIIVTAVGAVCILAGLLLTLGPAAALLFVGGGLFGFGLLADL